MRNKTFSRKLHSILSITLSLVMLLGVCFVVPVTAAIAEGTDVITIDFEGYTKGGNSTTVFNVYNTKTYGATAEDNTAFGSVHAAAYTGNDARYQYWYLNGNPTVIPVGTYQVTYDYYYTAEFTNTVTNPLATSISELNVVLAGNITSNTDGTQLFKLFTASEAGAGKWYKGVETVEITTELSNLGVRESFALSDWFIDNIVFTPVSSYGGSAYAEDHYIISDFTNASSDIASPTTMYVSDGDVNTAGSPFYKNTLFTIYSDSLSVVLWSGARHIRLNDTKQGLALRAGKTYSLTFSWLNANPEVEGVVQNKSIMTSEGGYESTAAIKLIANADNMNGTSYSVLATLLDSNDFSSAEGNKGVYVTKTVTFAVPYGTDITDIAISGYSNSGPTANQATIPKDSILLDNFQFEAEEGYPIDFENHSLKGSGYFGIDTLTGREGTDTKSFRAKKVSEDARYAQILNNGSPVSLSAGTYMFEYYWYISPEDTDLSANSSVKFAETNGLKTPWYNGSTIGSNIISANSAKGVWTKGSQYISLPNGLTALGIFATRNPTNIYIDDIKITKVDIVTFNYSDGTVEVKENPQGLTIPEDSAINFSHWVDSKGNIYSVGDAVVANETYTAVLKDDYKLDYSDTTDGYLRINVDKEAEETVAVLSKAVDGEEKYLRYTPGKSYLLQVVYKNDVAYDATVNKPEFGFTFGSTQKIGGTIKISTGDWQTSRYTYVIMPNNAGNISIKVKQETLDTLEYLDIKSVELIPFSTSDYEFTTEAVLFRNATDADGVIESKSLSKVNGKSIDAKSAVYNAGTEEAPDMRSLMRFVSSYNYGSAVNKLAIGDGTREITITERQMRLYDSAGVEIKAARAPSSASNVQTKTCWELDEENSRVSYSLAVYNISQEKSTVEYKSDIYVIIDDIIDATGTYSVWDEFNSLLIRSSKTTSSAQQAYDALVAEDSTIIGWYE